jgi:1-deoxy-D-xylulose-5-phosphate reductoisomerase
LEVKRKRVAILGSTGSIGRQTLEVISELKELTACALGAGSNWELLGEQARGFHPEVVSLADPGAAEQLRGQLPDGVELLVGENAAAELVRRARPDVLLCGMVGTAGLVPTLVGVECGARLAIANKETLVMAGAILIPAARQGGVDVLPVDSEHSGIVQCLRSGQRREVRKVTITASGGALRDWDPAEAENATVQQALNHPTWEMGRKITIDSATLVNKALELVEAHWLFDLGPEQLEVVLHPESIVHSYVEFCDGSVIAQMAQPDMKTPIAYALCYPNRPTRRAQPPKLTELGKLTFQRLEDRFTRAVELGYEVIRRGGVSGAVLNSANEAAVEAFLDRKISFGQIVPLVEDVLHRTPPAGREPLTLQELVKADAWARQEVNGQIAQTNAAPARNK